MIHTSSKYGPNLYGYQTFRDKNPDKWICDKVSLRNRTAKVNEHTPPFERKKKVRANMHAH